MPAILTLMVILPPTVARAASQFTVTNTNDTGAGSLRAAIVSANGAPGTNSIVFASSANGTITLASPLAISGPQTLSIAGNGTGTTGITTTGAVDPVFNVTDTSSLALSLLTVTNASGRDVDTQGPVSVSGASLTGAVASPAAAGGAIFAGGSGLNVAITNSTVNGSLTGIVAAGGAVFSNGPITVSGGSIHGTTSTLGAGGAIFDNAALTISGATITGVDGTDGSGGALFTNAALRVTNSTVGGMTSGAGNGGAIFANSTVDIASSSVSGSGSTGTGSGGAIHANGVLTAMDSTITGAALTGDGGAMLLNANATLKRSTVTGGGAARGGGIFIDATLTLVNSTIDGNSATALGGAIFNNATVTAVNSTLAGNTAPQGSGIYNNGGASKASFVNTIVADTASSECAGSGISSLGHNIDTGTTCAFTGPGDKSGVAALLGTLASNGGPTQTALPQKGSPAIDSGDNATCAAALVASLDQRGQPRFPASDPTCDVGAVEVQPVVVAPPPVGLPKAGRPPSGGGQNGLWLIVTLAVAIVLAPLLRGRAGRRS